MVYLSYLLLANLLGEKSPFPRESDVVFRFYLLLTLFTLFCTALIFCLFPGSSGGGGILWFLLLSLFLYLAILQRNGGYRYVIIIQELPRVPLVMALMLCASSVLFNLLFVYLEVNAQLAVTSGKAALEAGTHPTLASPDESASGQASEAGSLAAGQDRGGEKGGKPAGGGQGASGCGNHDEKPYN